MSSNLSSNDELKKTQFIQKEKFPNIGATIISTKHIFCQHIFYECFSTHKDLFSEDIKYASTIGCNVELSDKNLSIVLLHICKTTNTGRFSLIYNFNLDKAIINRDSQRIFELIKLPSENIKKTWPEVYDNESLLSIEKDTIINIYNKELNAVINVVSRGKAISPPYNIKFMTSCESLTESNGEIMKKYENDTTLYGICYRGVCIQESTDNSVQFNTDEPEKLIETLMVPEKSESMEINIHIVRCYDFLHLIHGLSMNPPVDPITTNSFSQITEKMLLTRYEKEIKMYKKFLSNI